jgi:hypothetical protein
MADGSSKAWMRPVKRRFTSSTNAASRLARSGSRLGGAIRVR